MHYKLMLMLIIVASSCGCSKEDNNSKVRIIGHAGMGLGQANSVYTDNSIESIGMAIAQLGCNGVEVDVQQDSEGNFWLYHDFQLDERSNLTGCIGSRSTAELQKGWYRSFHKEKIAPIELLETVTTEDQTLILDLKPNNLCNGTYSESSKWKTMISKLQQKTKFAEVIAVSMNFDWLHELADSSISLYYELTSPNEVLLNPSKFSMINGFMLRSSSISKEEVEQLHTLGKKVVIFDVRSPKSIRAALRKDVDYLITDDLRATLIER